MNAQSILDQRQLRSDEFAALFAQLDRHDTVASFEGGLMRLIGTMNTSRQDRDRH